MKAKTEIIELETSLGTLRCKVIRSRRKSYGVVVGKDASVELRIPLRGSIAKAREMAESWKDWITEKVSIQRSRAKDTESLREKSNARFTPAQRQALERRYRKAARDYIPARAKYYADILGVSFTRVRIAEQKTRWGSCSQSGTLSFHWKLMLAPEGVLDYVIIHEVCHLMEMNHSKKFWAWVAFLMPDYEEKRKWLKEHGEELQYY